jgi:hypothetical protein
MRRFLLAVAVLALLLIPAARQTAARTDVSIDFFYDNLSDGGSWLEVAGYGYCWQPSVAASNRSWRPYSDGYWAYTDVGWTWISYEDFGWATYHYGRWMRLRGRGWVWMPGRDWGPAWVSWRTGGDYVGWAPLPPRRSGDVFVEFSPINSRVDVDFDIGPASYNFIDVRYIGEPVLRERIYAADQNVTYITQTVNVTNITYINSAVYNYGPDFNTLSRYSVRPIQRLALQRETTVDPASAARSKSLMKVQGDKLVVAAPQQLQKPPNTVAPKVVKEKITQTQLERGWEPVADQKKQAELKEKFKKEDPKNIPPPTIQPSEKTSRERQATSAAPSGSTAPETASTVAPKPPKDKSQKNNVPAPAAVPPDRSSLPSAPTPPPMTKPEKFEKPKIESPADAGPKLKKEGQDRMQPPPANPAGKDDGKKQKKNEPSTVPTP